MALVVLKQLMWLEPPPWKRGLAANSPMNATASFRFSGSTSPSFLSSTMQSAAISAARACWASMSQGVSGQAFSA